MIYLSISSESHALSSLAMFSAFHMMIMVAHIFSVWAFDQRPSEFYSFGFVRVEALAYFTVAILSILSSIVTIKEAIEHILHNEENDFMEEPQNVDPIVFIVLLAGVFLQLWFTYLSLATVAFKGIVRLPNARKIPILSSYSNFITEKNFHLAGAYSSYALVILVFLGMR